MMMMGCVVGEVVGGGSVVGVVAGVVGGGDVGVVPGGGLVGVWIGELQPDSPMSYPHVQLSVHAGGLPERTPEGAGEDETDPQLADDTATEIAHWGAWVWAELWSRSTSRPATAGTIAIANRRDLVEDVRWWRSAERNILNAFLGVPPMEPKRQCCPYVHPMFGPCFRSLSRLGSAAHLRHAAARPASVLRRSIRRYRRR